MKRRSKWVVALLLTLAMVFSCIPVFADSGVQYLAPGQVAYQAGYTKDASGHLVDSKALFQIRPNQSGYIAVAVAELGYSTSAAYVTLLDANRQPVSERLWYYSASDTSYVVFGVIQGGTYYLKVEGAQGSYDNNYEYAIKYEIKAAPVRKNTKKSKAVNLKRKKAAKATVMAAARAKKTHWYKFKVTKKRTTKVVVDATYLKSGKTKATVYCGKKKIGSASIWNGRVNTFTVTNSNRYGKAKKGKYYVTIVGDANANGQYTVRYLK